MSTLKLEMSGNGYNKFLTKTLKCVFNGVALLETDYIQNFSSHVDMYGRYHWRVVNFGMILSKYFLEVMGSVERKNRMMKLVNFSFARHSHIFPETMRFGKNLMLYRIGPPRQ